MYEKVTIFVAPSHHLQDKALTSFTVICQQPMDSSNQLIFQHKQIYAPLSESQLRSFRFYNDRRRFQLLQKKKKMHAKSVERKQHLPLVCLSDIMSSKSGATWFIHQKLQSASLHHAALALSCVSQQLYFISINFSHLLTSCILKYQEINMSSYVFLNLHTRQGSKATHSKGSQPKLK